MTEKVHAQARTHAQARLDGRLAPEQQAWLTNLHALKRVGKPEEVARSVLYLASDDAAFVSGTAHLVDGGRRMAESLRSGGKVLAFGNGGSAADAQHFAAELVGRFTGISFAVADIDSACRRLVDGGATVGDPEPQGWGGILATIADPDGNRLQLVQYP